VEQGRHYHEKPKEDNLDSQAADDNVVTLVYVGLRFGRREYAATCEVRVLVKLTKLVKKGKNAYCFTYLLLARKTTRRRQG
jgi:hypothetical protein